MPYRKPYRKKRQRRNRRGERRWRRQARRNFRPARGLTPQVMSFKRSRTEMLILNNTSAPSGWTTVDNGISVPLVFSLSQIPDSTDFVNLFNSYKIVGIRMQGWYSNSVADSENQQSMVYWVGNSMGNVLGTALDEQYFLDRPTHKKRVLVNSMGKPSFDLYMKMSQLSQIYQSTVNTDYGLSRPRFISTGETTTGHYGVSMHIRRLDGNNWTAGTTNPYPQLKINYTYYFKCRGIS